MTTRPKPCTLGKKHKWEFVKNTTHTTTDYGPAGTRIHIRYKGIYKCACGQRKLGQTQYESQAAAIGLDQPIAPTPGENHAHG